MKPRKVSEDSAYNQQKKLWQHEEDLSLDGLPWTNEQMDELLDLFLQGAYYQSQRDCFQSRCKRSLKSVLSHLWKLAVRYPNSSAALYVPNARETRTGCTWTGRDLAILELATGDVGIKNKAYDEVWLAFLLGRTRQEIHGKIAELVKEYSSHHFGMQPVQTEEDIAKLVHKTVRDSWKKAHDSLASA